MAQASQAIGFGALSAQLSTAAPFAVSTTGGASGNPVTFAASPSTVCTAGGTDGSTITIVGVGTCTVTASQAGTTNYLAAPDVSHTFTVTAPPQSTTLSVAAASGSYGGSADLYATLKAGTTPVGGKTIVFSLNGTAVCGVSGAPTCPTTDAITGIATLSGVSLAVINAGTYANGVSASFAGDGAYTTTSGSNTLTVTKAKQTITVTTAAPSSKVYNGIFTVAATSDSGLTVSYGSSGGCTNSGAAYTMTSGATLCTVTFDQAGNTTYNAATQVTETVTATKASATIALSHLNQTYDGSAKYVTATTTPASLSGVTTTYAQGNTAVSAPTNAGSYSVDASLNNANYTASDATGTLVIANGSQTITFDLSALTAKTYGDAAFSISSDASASSGLTVGFSSAATGVCTVSGGTVTIVSAGTCTVGADQAGNTNYNKAPQVQQSRTIARAPLTITAMSTSMTYGGSVPALAVSYAGLVNFDTAASLATAPACTTTAIGSSPVGAYPIACAGVVAPNYSIGYAGGTLTIQQAPQAIAFGPLPNALLGDAPMTVAATGGASGSPVAFSAGPAEVCLASGTAGQTITLVGVGTCTVTATQAGNANYQAAAAAAQAFVVAYPPLSLLLSVTSSPPSPATTGSLVTVSFQLGNHTAATQSVSGALTLTYTGGRGSLSLPVPFAFTLAAGQTQTQSRIFTITAYFPRGTYTVSVSAMDGAGDTASRTASLIIS